MNNEQEELVWLCSFDPPGWYSPEYHFVIPDDAVPVSEARMAELKEGMAAGKILVRGEDGEPDLADRPPPSAEALAEIERLWRDRQLIATDPLVTRHRDELELEQPTTLPAAKYQELQQYRAALRQWPESEAFPTEDGRPGAPAWLNDL